MDMQLKQDFIERWNRHFPGADLPLGFYYTDDASRGESVPPAKGHRCAVGLLALARQGRPLRLDIESTNCPGGKRHFGFSQDLRPNFEYFLSCGIPGQLEGARYKKSPEVVRELIKNTPVFKAPAPYLIFKRWDLLDEADTPEAVVFFAKPDVLSGLFMLSGYEESNFHAVAAPLDSGCATIVQHPYLEKDAERPRVFLGMLDVSSRPSVAVDTLSFAIPMRKFARMVADMDESFLIMPSWNTVKSRLA